MKTLKGKYKKVFIDAVREDLRHYAMSVDEDALKAE